MKDEESFVVDPAWTRVEESLWKALWALMNGEPTNEQLAKAASNGRLKVSYSTVALEAGCSRTLIGTADCKYQKVREAIDNVKGVNPLVVENKRLKALVAELEVKLAQSDSLRAEVLVRARAIQKERGEKNLDNLARAPKKERAGMYQVIKPSQQKDKRP